MKKNKHLNPWKDIDRDGVINLHDCQPFNPKKQEVYKWRNVKSKITSDKNNLYHKTELSAANQILKSGKLNSSMSGEFSMSEHHNPRVVFKTYKQPVTLVLDKKKIPDVKKVDYSKPQHMKYKSEKEWVSKGGSVKGVLKGIILNEHFVPSKLKSSEVGVNRHVNKSLPTRYVTEKDMYKIKFKGNDFGKI